MSETSQGPDWWLASDGKWYPPHLHPWLGPPTPPPPPPPNQGSGPGAQPAGGGIEESYGRASAGFGAPPSGLPPTAWPPAAGGWGSPNPGVYGAPAWPAAHHAGAVDPVLRVRLAPWWKRFVALIIDNLILGLGLFILVLILGIAVNASRSPGSSSTSSSHTHGAALLAGLVILWTLAAVPVGLYFGFMNGSRRGQTVGKLALSIAVRDARTGAPIGFWRAWGRFLITVLFSLLLYLPYVIDSLAPLWDNRRQSWHDKVARTVVVDLKP